MVWIFNYLLVDVHCYRGFVDSIIMLVSCGNIIKTYVITKLLGIGISTGYVGVTLPAILNTLCPV